MWTPLYPLKAPPVIADDGQCCARLRTRRGGAYASRCPNASAFAEPLPTGHYDASSMGGRVFGWCGLHAPSQIEAREKNASARRQAERERRHAAWQAEKAAEAAEEARQRKADKLLAWAERLLAEGADGTPGAQLVAEIAYVLKA